MNADPNFDTWRKATDHLMNELYFITLAKAGVEEWQLQNSYRAGETPLQFVKSFAEDYEFIDYSNPWLRP